VATSDGYTAATTIELPGIKRLRIQVFNASVLFTVGYGIPPSRWEPDAGLAPGPYSLDANCDGVRFKSLVSGVPARVMVTALTKGEL
jgi:hypothetical protein